VEYLVYILIVAGIVGLLGKTYFEKQLAAKAKTKRDAAAATKRRGQLALAAPEAGAGGRKRQPQFGRR
jgi:hypothetical protein